MPRYIYRCLECMATQTYVHSMSTMLGQDDKCSACGSRGSLVREPAIFTTKSDLAGHKGKPGDLVNEFISDTKEAVSKEKQVLKKGYKP